ncbi:MAG: hypothetical protein SWK90_15775 [Chloroflexota bacterium]|nr:hypothetical protein [Chloroflexota bacterium]
MTDLGLKKASSMTFSQFLAFPYCTWASANGTRKGKIWQALSELAWSLYALRPPYPQFKSWAIFNKNWSPSPSTNAWFYVTITLRVKEGKQSFPYVLQLFPHRAWLISYQAQGCIFGRSAREVTESESRKKGRFKLTLSLTFLLEKKYDCMLLFITICEQYLPHSQDTEKYNTHCFNTGKRPNPQDFTPHSASDSTNNKSISEALVGQPTRAQSDMRW